MRIISKPVLALLGFHFILLLTGMFGVSFRKLGPIGTALDTYGRLTGSRGSFGFFSPNVGNQLTIGFTVKTRDGKAIQTRLEDLVSKETAVRVGNMNRLFTQFLSQPRLRRSIATSLSTHVFERFPEALEVEFVADLFSFPSLSDYGRGIRAQSTPVYRATFRRTNA